MSADTSEFFIWPTTFSCSLIVGNVLLPINYNLTVGMMPAAGQSISITGLTKIKEFISKFVQNSIIINQENAFLDRLSYLDTNTVQLPEEPTDYFFSNILFYKLTSITQDHFAIRQITVDSTIGDHVQYQITESNDAYNEILNNDGWWNRNDVSTNNTHHFPSWEDLNIHAANRFSPKIVKGGRSETKSVQRSNT